VVVKHYSYIGCSSASPAASAACRRAALAAARAAPSALHTCLCPARQSACEQAVPQYHTARQALQRGVDGRSSNMSIHV